MRLDMRWIALALLMPVAAARADSNVDYAYAFALDTQTPAEAYRVALTPEVYASVNPNADLHDLIVVNALGRPVPFAPLPPSPPVRHHFETTARLLPLPVSAAAADSVKVERNTDGGIVISQTDRAAPVQHPDAWLIDAGRAISLDQLALDPASLSQDFQLHVTVEGSSDLRQWNLLASDLSLTRVHGEQDEVEQLAADVSSSDAYRYFRVRLADGQVDWSVGHAPIAKLSGNITDAAAERASKLQWLAAKGSGQGDYDYELPAALPVESVIVALPAANNAARVHVLMQSEGASSWMEVAALDLVRTGGKSGEATAAIGERNVKHLRVHSDTPLADAPALRVGWLPAQFVFLPEGSAPYRLLAGSHAARRGDYPVGEALSRLHSQHDAEWQPPVAQLGPRSDEAGPSALEAPKVPYDWTRPLLWVVLTLGALVVAGMAFSLLRQGREDAPKS
jgi:hypothetical protein